MGSTTANIPADQEHPHKVSGYAAHDTSGKLSPFQFSRRENGEDDIAIKVLFCGVCHSDLHMVKNDWGFTHYPVVPGHEMVGVVTKVGSNVTKLKVGDRAGVGVYCDSCRSCDRCEQHLENYCTGIVDTYNGFLKGGVKTYGGYSEFIVVDQRYVHRFPDGLPADAGAPLLCAGITVYSPMMYYGLNEPGKHLGVAGVGGLGHIAVKMGKAFGLKVTAIVRNEDEVKQRQGLGADAFLCTSNPEQMKAASGTLDYILSTISAPHSLEPMLKLLKLNGKLINVGLPEKPLELPLFPLVQGRRLVGGSTTGGLKETQEMLDFCAKHGIAADIELVKLEDINAAMERLARGDVKYRFVIDMENSLKSA